VNWANMTIALEISLERDFDAIESVLRALAVMAMIKNSILISAVVSLLITSAGGLLSSLKNSSASDEVNETIVNYKSFSTNTMELKLKVVLEQRLADVL
jgi:hypothetical protein